MTRKSYVKPSTKKHDSQNIVQGSWLYYTLYVTYSTTYWY